MSCQTKWFACSNVVMQTMTVLSPRMKSSRCLNASTNSVSKVDNVLGVNDLMVIVHSDHNARNNISLTD